MAIEAMAAAMAVPPASAAPPASLAGFGASLTDIDAAGGFSAAMARAVRPGPVPSAASADAADAIGPAVKGLFKALDRVNGEAQQVGNFANAAMVGGRDMTPGEIVQLTMRCHEFMFHCQLSSSIANRTSDGLQQLFRQQS